MADQLAVYTTWYPGVERFLADWAESIRQQTDQDFDVWIGVDRFDPAPWVDRLGERRQARLLPVADGTPAQIRGRAIARIVEEYPAVVFVDSDDRLYPTRVEGARKALAVREVDACALRIMNETGQDLGIRFEVSTDVDWSGFLPHYNVFGLSNSAYRSDVLARCLPIPDDCILVDWLLATRAWASGAEVGFDPCVRMAYRQYPANIAAVLPPFSSEGVRAAAECVRGHYRFVLSENGNALPEEPRRLLERARERVERFCGVTGRSAERLGRYVEALNALPPTYVWWWAVAHPDLEDLWSH